MKVSCMIPAVVVFAVLCFAVKDVSAHMHNIMKYVSVMSPDGKFQLQWAYNNDTGMLYFKMKCQNTGWCGVGFADNAVNPTGKNMRNFDVAIGGFTDTGYLEDYWSSGLGKPAVDELKNVTLINASETNGNTMVDFKRPAYSDNPQDVSIMSNTEVWIMYGSAAADATDANTFLKHDARQALSMKYNLIAMAMAAETATEPQATTASGTIIMPSSVSAIVSTTASTVRSITAFTVPSITGSNVPATTASATKCGGSHSVFSIILVSIARFVFSS